MKRTIILSLLGVVTAVGSMAQEAFTVDDISYLPTGTKTVTVTACTLGEGCLAVLPESVKYGGTTYLITAIGEEAFSGSDVAAVYMPETVCSVGARAFANCTATFIKLSPNITAIGAAAFEGCPALGHLDLPDGLERLEHSTLASTPLYTIGESALPRLNYVGDYALTGTQLQHFPLTDAVTYVGAGAFSQCRYLQDIHLPAGLTEISDCLLEGCTGITQVTLPAGITRIGRSAFSGSGIRSMELSQYQGSIGLVAFNGCYHLDRLTLPADNAYCYTSEDGKVLYSRSDQQLLSVLPTAERIVIPYPATGVHEEILHDTYTDSETGEEVEYESAPIYTYPLTGNFNNLTELELPHSWKAPFGNGIYIYTPNLQKLTMRMPADVMAKMAPPSGIEGCHIYVFNYAMDALTATNSLWFNYVGQQRDPETREYYYTNLHAIDYPSEQLYMAEVLPMYDNLRYVTDRSAILWDADWNAAIETAYPQYFTAGEVSYSFSKNYKELFRNYLAAQYLTPARIHAFVGDAPTRIRCIDGTLTMASEFDAGNYVNWYLHNNFIPASNYVPDSNPLSPNYTYYQNGYSYNATYCQVSEGDPAWQQPVNEVSLLYRELSDREGTLDPSTTRTTEVVYALHMVPGVAYNIYAIVPPRHPLSYDATDEQEGMEYYNKFSTRLTYISEISESGHAITKNTSYADADVRFESKQVEKILLHENVEVISDVYNLLTVTSTATGSDLRKNGYTHALALIGIVCEPQTELEYYPDAVAVTRTEGATVVERYDLQGRRLAAPHRGVNILRMSDGTTRKVMVK